MSTQKKHRPMLSAKRRNEVNHLIGDAIDMLAGSGGEGVRDKLKSAVRALGHRPTSRANRLTADARDDIYEALRFLGLVVDRLCSVLDRLDDDEVGKNGCQF